LGWGWPRFVKRSDLESKYVTNGWITIVYGIIVVRDDPLPVPLSDIGDHLGGLLDRTDGSDVSFVVDGKEFAAHRAVLAARSPVFKAELFGSMAEATLSRITLDDIEPAIFKAFLRFMYTDSLPEDDELGDSAKAKMYQRLLAVADRYAMDRLKLICARKLWDNVTVDTVAATLCHAETYNCPELKGKCIAFFAEEKNFRDAVLTDGFVELVQRFPSIIVELREKAKT
jgi:speckle-type POZ protein